jgi:hypothetical protein
MLSNLEKEPVHWSETLIFLPFAFSLFPLLQIKDLWFRTSSHYQSMIVP